MVLSPEEDEEDGPLSVPPAGDPEGDAPLVLDEDEDEDEEAVDDRELSSSSDGASLGDLDDGPPSAPPPWDEEPSLASDDADAAEVLALLVPTDEDAPLDRDEDEGDDIDLPLPMKPEDLLDEPFDPLDED